MSTKKDIAAMVAGTNRMTKADAAAAVDSVFKAIRHCLSYGDKVQIAGFGGFEVQQKAARRGRNPATGETIQIPAKRVVKFKPSVELRENV